MPVLKPDLTRLLRSEEGSATIMSLFFVVTSIVLGGLAIDFANRTSSEAKMHATADAVAHAALVLRGNSLDPAVAKLEALKIAEGNMPAAQYGSAVTEPDIEYGVWDGVNRVFTPDVSADQAVRVTVRRIPARGNIIDNLLLRTIGYSGFEAEIVAVFERYRPTCLREGLAAEGRVAITTGNRIARGFCVYSGTHVEMNTDNTFESGSVVSMPNRHDAVLPTDGLAKNPGLEAALRDGYYELAVMDRLQEYIPGATDPTSRHFRDYITSATTVTLDRKAKLDNTAFTPGAIHVLDCTSQTQSAAIHAGTVLSNVVLVTNCQLKLGENVALEDSTIVSTNTTTAAVTGASGIRFGRDDNCADGGGAQLLTYGGIRFPQSIKLFGSQLIAGGAVDFTSDANGVQGASIIAGGTLSGTSAATLGFCNGQGMGDNFDHWYFRMVH